MRRYDDINEKHPAHEAFEQAEQQSRRFLEQTRRTFSGLLSGTDRPINQRGDRLFTSDRPEQRALAAEQQVYRNNQFHLRTTRGGTETGRTAATLELQRDEHGIVSNRTRLNFIEVHPPYRGQGHSDAMLDEVEQQARRYGSTEVYGAFEPTEAREHARVMYERNGYLFRPHGSALEVYKPLEPSSSPEARLLQPTAPRPGAHTTDTDDHTDPPLAQAFPRGLRRTN